VPRQTVKSNAINLFFSLVAGGNFISAVPASILRFNGGRLGLKGLSFEFPVRPAPICIATFKERKVSPASRLFIEHARKLAVCRTQSPMFRVLGQ